MIAPEARAHIERAIRQFDSEARLGAACGVSQSMINKAKKLGRVSARLATAIHHATGGAVPRHTLRPDIFAADDVVPAIAPTRPRPTTPAVTLTIPLEQISDATLWAECLRRGLIVDPTRGVAS